MLKSGPPVWEGTFFPTPGFYLIAVDPSGALLGSGGSIFLGSSRRIRGCSLSTPVSGNSGKRASANGKGNQNYKKASRYFLHRYPSRRPPLKFFAATLQ